MVYDKANELARELAESPEYARYKSARERAFANDTTKALVSEYTKLRVRAQGALLSGAKDENAMARLQKLGETLQLDRDASEYLLAEYAHNTMLGDVYKILASAIDVDLGLPESR